MLDPVQPLEYETGLYRSCNNTQEIWSFVLFINKTVHENKAWICLHVALFLINKTKDQISWVSSYDLNCENKMYKRMRSTDLSIRTIRYAEKRHLFQKWDSDIIDIL